MSKVAARRSQRANGSKIRKENTILSFFQKVESRQDHLRGNGQDDGDGLFVVDRTSTDDSWTQSPTRHCVRDEIIFGDHGMPDEVTRLVVKEAGIDQNESGRSAKKRRMEHKDDENPHVRCSDDSSDTTPMPRQASTANDVETATLDLPNCLPAPDQLLSVSSGCLKAHNIQQPGNELSTDVRTRPENLAGRGPKPRRCIGPFDDTSDSDETGTVAVDHHPASAGSYLSENDKDRETSLGCIALQNHVAETDEGSVKMAGGKRPTLLRDSTSYMESPDDFNGLDYTDDEFAEGEEYMERLMMEEQLRLEAVDDGLEDEIESARPAISSPSTPDLLASGEQLCPMCGAGLGGMADHDVQVHVNSCLDERKIPVPQDKEPLSKLPGDLNPSNRIQRPPKPAKPGQASPFALGQAAGVSSSAFTKLMSSHAEDAAWATAAAAEQAARGKPAFQRTCPFYKILPGLSICVDAFRYGAVEGCRAYFLSHFHSDHYIGLTSSWAHGPIYCSRITANLVKQQLRVDPNFVVDLEFEEKSEVPETNGVQVTMISANHCPGSSLFLFEKVIGRGKTPKTQRILHCGDFRACPAHIHHALLRPTVLDPSTGKCVGQQKIDVCYLDTTYLNPRYAFPSQEKVVGACADMCVSLRNEFLDQNDEWEKVKQRRAGSGMTKFVQVGAEDGVSPASHDPVDAMQVNTRTNGRSRGRLLVVVGTYSIGKERICLGIARALDCKIFAPPGKRRICACLEDAELTSRLTADPYEAQVHMTPLFEIRAETLQDYLNSYKPRFSRIIGFRPSGWNYKPPNSRFVESPAVQTVLQSSNWKSSYSMADLVPQRGSTREASCFGVPYSEHSSFRELTIFCCALRIDKIIPTVNVGSAKSREKMKAWFEKWAMEKKKHGVYEIADGVEEW